MGWRNIRKEGVPYPQKWVRGGLQRLLPQLLRDLYNKYVWNFMELHLEKGPEFVCGNGQLRSYCDGGRVI